MAAFLALAGHEVCCVARGEHLRAMLGGGLKFRSDIKGEVTLPVYRPGAVPAPAAEGAGPVGRRGRKALCPGIWAWHDVPGGVSCRFFRGAEAPSAEK